MTPDRLELSLSELGSLVTKAARGAGLTWGMAEEAGWAADWLARRSLPAADWAAVWLGALLDGRANAVQVGVDMADRLACADGPLPRQDLPPDLPAPGYLLPFLHRLTQHFGVLDLIGTAGLAARLTPDGAVEFGPAWSDSAGGWTLSQTGDAPGQGGTAVSVVDCLEGLALRTMVPASSSSRQDAGAASSDND